MFAFFPVCLLEDVADLKFFCWRTQDMKGFTPDMLVQQLKEKVQISDILSIKYMDQIDKN